MLHILELETQFSHIYNNMMRQKHDVADAIAMFEDADIRTATARGGTVENYQYFMYPFKGFTLANHGVYNTLAEYLANMVAPDTEVIVSIEADGIGIATLVAAHLRLPLVIAKSFHYGVDCVSFTQQTGYYNREMFMTRDVAGKKVAIVDCMVSTGGTVKNMIDVLTSKLECGVTGVHCLNNKSNYQSDSIFGDTPYSYLFNAYIQDDRVVCDMSDDFKHLFWKGINMEFHTITKAMSEHMSTKSRMGYGVGALIVDIDSFEIVGWGYRRGHVHAEQDAISMLKNNTPDWEDRRYMVYSTMEPCSMRNGNYTPCAHLISAVPQFKWIIVGERDMANSEISGRGIEYLLDHGKNVRIIDSNEHFYGRENVHTNEIVQEVKQKKKSLFEPYMVGVGDVA